MPDVRWQWFAIARISTRLDLKISNTLLGHYQLLQYCARALVEEVESPSLLHRTFAEIQPATSNRLAARVFSSARIALISRCRINSIASITKII